MKETKCVFCKTPIEDGCGNNPEPLKSKGECCDRCNLGLVIPFRLKGIIINIQK